MRETASDILIKDSPPFWSFENSTYCVLNGFDKPHCQRRIAFGVVLGCLPVFLQCLRVELPSHRRMTSRTFWRA